MTLTEQAIAYHEQLTSDAIDYLTGPKRLLTKPTIDHFKVGWIGEPLDPTHVKFRGSPTIPYLTVSGKVIQIRVRAGGKAKYLPLGYDHPLPGQKTMLFNAMQALPTSRRSTTILTEGEFDAMLAWQCGYKAAALPGATNWKDRWGHLLAQSKVLLAFDGDKAGREASDRLTDVLTGFHVDVEAVDLPAGEDLTSYFAEHGTLEPLLGRP